jgi:U3 small nucleolar RNA-associated protein 23
MRVLRKKRVRKKLGWFRTIFKISTPYKVLVDPDFLKEALTRKIFVREELPKFLQDKAYMVITSCIFKQLKKLGDQYSGAALMGKRLQRIVCPHEGDEEGVSAEECILTIAKGKVKYVMAIQNYGLRKELRQIPGVPLLYINPRKLLTMEDISHISKNYNIQELEKHLSVPEEEKKLCEDTQEEEQQPNENNDGVEKDSKIVKTTKLAEPAEPQEVENGTQEVENGILVEPVEKKKSKKGTKTHRSSRHLFE